MVAYQGDVRFENKGAGGLGRMLSVRGTGYVAITTKGDPVALDVASAPTFADPQAVVLWTAGVNLDVRVDTGGIKSMVRGGTGETFQMAFGGNGYVLVQPSESVIEGGLTRLAAARAAVAWEASSAANRTLGRPP